MVIGQTSWADWLDPANGNTGDLRSLLVPAVSGRLISYPVATTVNSVRNNGPELIEPIEPGPAAELSAAESGADDSGTADFSTGRGTAPGALF